MTQSHSAPPLTVLDGGSMRHAFPERHQLGSRTSLQGGRVQASTDFHSDPDPALFFTIAGQGSELSSHGELWRWLAGDVQKFLPHDILLVGWGNFRSGDLQFDVISSLPGVRSQNFEPSSVKPLIACLRDSWAAASHLPCHVRLDNCKATFGNASDGSAGLQAFAGMRGAVVHGIGDRGHGGERVFAALSTQPGSVPGAPMALKLLMPFIDTALRQIEPLPLAKAAAQRLVAERLASRQDGLTDRERQIMVWVALGKTNPEIGCILHISEFTVKNHMKSIFGKLDVSNRAQAVSKLTSVAAHA